MEISMLAKLDRILIRYQGAISFVLVMLMLGLAIGLSEAKAEDLPHGLKGKHIEIPVICGKTQDMYRALTEDHGEVPVSIAFSERQTAVVWFTNPDKSTMSFVIDTPDGESCMLYSTRCPAGDCHMTPGEVVEQAEEILNDSPKVSL